MTTPPPEPPAPGSANPDPARDAAILGQALQGEWPALPPDSRPALLLLCGLPGSGKSYFAAALAQRIPLVILSSDRLRKILIPRPRYTRGEHRRVFAAAHLLLAQLLAAGYAVVFDATNRTARARQPLYEMAEQAGAPLLIVEFTAPEEVVRQRLARRAAGTDTAPDSAGYRDYSDADWRIYCQMRPGGEPIDRPHYRVDSSGDITPVLAEIAERLGG